MPFLDSIVGLINTGIETKLNASKVIISLKGISKQVPRTDTEETQIPLYIDNSGEGQFNAVDDKFSVTIYHKCEGLTYESVEGLEFGDGQNFSRETANMVLICWADRKRIQMTQEWLASLVASGFPTGVSKAFKQARLGLSDATINITNVENDSLSVWSREFINIPYSIPPESILFRINYTIQTDFNKSCIELCEECPPVQEDVQCDCTTTVLFSVSDPVTSSLAYITKIDLSEIPVNILVSDFLLNPELLVSALLAGGCNACTGVTVEPVVDNIYRITLSVQSSSCPLLELSLFTPPNTYDNSDFSLCP